VIIHPCQQGSDEWHRLRCGIPTASRFDQILTPKTLKPSASAFGYLCEKFAEWDLGPIDETSAQWMQRGQKMEEQARAWYAWEYQVDVQEVGFVTNDAKDVGCSPDGLLAQTFVGLEIKVPSAKQHVAYLLEPQRLIDAYKLQIQGAMWVCERLFWDILSWHPSMPKMVQRVERDEEVIEKLAAAVAAFNEQLNEALRKWGYREPK
jgi:hypothetical protein